MSCVCEPSQVDGYGYVRWIGDHFADCVYTPTQRVSFFLGLLSILLWIPALFPQILTNYRTKRTDALSIGFVLQWLLGDLSNVIGCLWAQMLPTQLWTAIYFSLTDVVLLSQYAYYKGFHRVLPSESSDTLPDESVDESDGLVGTGHVNHRGRRGTASKQALYSVALVSLVLLSQSSFTASQSPQVLLSTLPLCDAAPELSLVQLTAGCLASWISGLLYFSSRIPQVYHNYQRQSTEGLSLALFVLSILANLAYGVSVFLRLGDMQSAKFWRATAPFIIGSLGTIVLDVVIVLQTLLYKQKGDDGDGLYETIGDGSSSSRTDRSEDTPRLVRTRH